MTDVKTKAEILGVLDKLAINNNLSDDELETILNLKENDFELNEYLAEKARFAREKVYGKDVYIRGLIEFTNYCKNNCYYCGIRRSNCNAERYRLSEEKILSCCEIGYNLGFRTFVLQGGEDQYYTDEVMVSIIEKIKNKYPETAVTLSIGEKSKESYKKFYDAGAERYLLRHETADKSHYNSLHPDDMSYDNRIRCLYDLHDIGYQVGCGMMVGSPGQNIRHIIKDLRFIQEFKPEMVGIGPFIPHHDTEFAAFTAGTVDLTLRILSIIRLMIPNVLLPATTALGTIDPTGREKGILAGANVVMPNLSPTDVRNKYLLYDDKICTGDEAAECIKCLSTRISKTGYQIVVSRGDYISDVK